MKVIQDIRLFEDTDGVLKSRQFADRPLLANVQRIVMKLRENGFSLGEFHHLYVDLTTRQLSAPMEMDENIDIYAPWYRYVYVQISEEMHGRLNDPDSREEILSIVKDVLTGLFATESFDRVRILSCIEEAKLGEQMLMKFKEKTTSTRRAVLYLRFLDTCRFWPLIRVYDPEGALLAERDMPPMITLDALGEIQVSRNKVTVKPRKSSYTTNMEPFVFTY